MKPKISIIIPAYNREKVISKTLEAILSQTFEDWECLVVDDHSKDATRESIMQFVAKDSRFVFLENERTKGACGARNTGLQHAKSDFVLFFDSDDRMHEDLLASLYGHFTDDVDVVTCWTSVVDVDLGKQVDTFSFISEGNIHDALLSEKTYVDTNCALIRRHVCEQIDGWSEDCPSFQEWDFHIRLSKVARYTTLKKILIDYYVGGSDTISKGCYRTVLGKLYILKKFKNEFLYAHPMAYFRNAMMSYCLILDHQKVNKVEADILFQNYRDTIAPSFQVLVGLLGHVRNLKKMIKNS